MFIFKESSGQLKRAAVLFALAEKLNHQNDVNQLIFLLLDPFCFCCVK